MATAHALAKKAAWAEFSKFIRTRDCLKTTGGVEEGICITCDLLIPFKGSHAGHFIGGRGNEVLFAEDLENLQCGSCNIGLDGNYPIYTLKMRELHGEEWVKEKAALRRKPKQYKTFELLEIKELYKQKTKELLENR